MFWAVKVTPEQSLEGENGVEWGNSWLDWINWKYLGFQDPQKHVNISVIWDYYAISDRSRAKVYVVSQTGKARTGLKVALEFFDLDGSRKYFTEISGFNVGTKFFP